MTNEMCLFPIRLPYQQTIERIFVVVGELFEREYMVERDRQNLNTVCLSLIGDNVWKRSVQLQLPKLKLDLHFPRTGHAEYQVVCRIFARGTRRAR